MQQVAQRMVEKMVLDTMVQNHQKIVHMGGIVIAVTLASANLVKLERKVRGGGAPLIYAISS